MDSDMMLDLPLGDMMNPGCLVVVWVTNKQKHIKFIAEQFFPANNIQVKAKWFWLKVTELTEFIARETNKIFKVLTCKLTC